MDEHQPYDPEVYKRLELVRKQFKRQAAEQKTQQNAEKQHQLVDWLAGHQPTIVRWAAYIFLIALVLAVTGVLIAARLR